MEEKFGLANLLLHYILSLESFVLQLDNRKEFRLKFKAFK